jgi:hypothetical protein
MIGPGCGKGEVTLPQTGATLEGDVTYGNEKVGCAMIRAVGSGAVAIAHTFVDDNGHYKLENVPLGTIRFEVDESAGNGNMMGRRMAGEKNLPKVLNIPKKYAKADESGLSTTIEKGPNTYNIKIPK